MKTGPRTRREDGVEAGGEAGSFLEAHWIRRKNQSSTQSKNNEELWRGHTRTTQKMHTEDNDKTHGSPGVFFSSNDRNPPRKAIFSAE